MKVVVYNGSGAQGTAIVSSLIAHGHEPLVVTRSPEKLTDRPGVRAVYGDLGDLETLRAASQGADALALTISFAIPDEEVQFNYAQNAIRAAVEAGVRFIVYNASGPVVSAHRVGAGYDVRPRIIAALAASGIPYTVLKPTTYMENLLGPWTRHAIVTEGVVRYPVLPDRRVGWLAIADLGALMTSALEQQHAHTQFDISGPDALTGDELAARFSTVLGRPMRYEMMSLDAFAAALDTLIGLGASASVIPGYELRLKHPESVHDYTDMRPVLEKLPVRLTTFDEWISRMAFLFTAEQPVAP